MFERGMASAIGLNSRRHGLNKRLYWISGGRQLDSGGDYI